MADDDESSHVGAARPPGVPPLEVDRSRTVPALAELGGYDLLVVDPGALRLAPDALEHRVHADLPSLPIVFYSGLRPEYHLRALMRERLLAGAQPLLRLVWAMPSLVHWIVHGEYPLTIDLPRRLAEIGGRGAGRQGAGGLQERRLARRGRRPSP